MNVPSGLRKTSVVLSLVLEEVTDDDDDDDADEGDDVIDGDDHDGLVVSALRRQETLGESEQQVCRITHKCMLI